MTRTDIMCPECMKKKLLTTTDDKINEDKTWCDNCGTEFIKTGPSSVKYK